MGGPSGGKVAGIPARMGASQESKAGEVPAEGLLVLREGSLEANDGTWTALVRGVVPV